MKTLARWTVIALHLLFQALVTMDGANEEREVEPASVVTNAPAPDGVSLDEFGGPYDGFVDPPPFIPALHYWADALGPDPWAPGTGMIETREQLAALEPRELGYLEYACWGASYGSPQTLIDFVEQFGGHTFGITADIEDEADLANVVGGVLALREQDRTNLLKLHLHFEAYIGARRVIGPLLGALDGELELLTLDYLGFDYLRSDPLEDTFFAELITLLGKAHATGLELEHLAIGGLDPEVLETMSLAGAEAGALKTLSLVAPRWRRQRSVESQQAYATDHRTPLRRELLVDLLAAGFESVELVQFELDASVLQLLAEGTGATRVYLVNCAVLPSKR